MAHEELAPQSQTGASSGLRIDIARVPWSHPGSYMSVVGATHPSDHPGRDVEVPEGIYLLDVSGLRLWRWNGVFRLDFAGDDLPEVETTPGKMSIRSGAVHVEVTWLGEDTLRFAGRGGPMRLVESVIDPLDASVRVPTGDGAWRLQMGEDAHFALDPIIGAIDVAGLSVRTGQEAEHEPRVVHVVPDHSGAFEFLLTQFEVGWPRRTVSDEFASDVVRVDNAFESFRAPFGSVPAHLEEAADTAAYILWSHSVGPRGLLKRPSLLMSKNWMHAVWSWDHCFNAIGLAPAHPSLAWDQMMTVFDHQHENGSLPDIIHDSGWMRGVVKPPVHGWALRQLLQRMEIDDGRLATAYDMLVRWTDWWTTYQTDGRGLWVCLHGNDTGQDNSSAFDMGFPATTPDICAYMVMQLDVLAGLARRLGRESEAVAWSRRADEALDAMIERLWDGDHFVAIHAISGERSTQSMSQTGYLPLALGERLPDEIAGPLVASLEANGLITSFGLASESPRSPLFEPDGYWRGAVWAPTNLLVSTGLRQLGRDDLADQIADGFVRSCLTGGFAENFDATSGAGLRDPAYSWTAAVFWAFVGR